MTMIAYAPVLLLLLILLVSAIKVLREYERGVVFQLGRYWKVKGPGLIILIPVVQQMVRIDLRTIVMDVPEQDVISRDNVSVKVNAVVYRSEEHTSELQSLMRISYAVFCLKKKNTNNAY